MFGLKKKKITGIKNTISEIESALNGAFHTNGFMEYYLGYETQNRDILKLEFEDYSIRVGVVQYQFFKQVNFSIDISFYNDTEEEYVLETCNLYSNQPSVGTKYDMGKKVCFESPEIRRADLYESAVKEAAEKIIEKHKSEILYAIRVAIEEYTSHQASHEDSFRQKYL